MFRPVLALLGALALAACVSDSEGPTAAGVAAADARADQGRRLAERMCARCHATGGESPNAAAPPLAVLAMRYDQLTLKRKLQDIASGHYEMPPTAVSDDEVTSLAAWLERLAGR